MMKTQKKDELYEIFIANLSEMNPDKHEEDQLISKTVEDYLSNLFAEGYIPSHFVDDIEEDIRLEVKEMYRKKTYGFMDLKTYLKSNKPKSKARSS